MTTQAPTGATTHDPELRASDTAIVKSTWTSKSQSLQSISPPTWFAAHEVGAVVVGDDQRLAALVSEREVVRVVAAGEDPASVRALDVALGFGST